MNAKHVLSGLVKLVSILAAAGRATHAEVWLGPAGTVESVGWARRPSTAELAVPASYLVAVSAPLSELALVAGRLAAGAPPPPPTASPRLALAALVAELADVARLEIEAAAEAWRGGDAVAALVADARADAAETAAEAARVLAARGGVSA